MAFFVSKENKFMAFLRARRKKNLLKKMNEFLIQSFLPFFSPSAYECLQVCFGVYVKRIVRQMFADFHSDDKELIECNGKQRIANLQIKLSQLPHIMLIKLCAQKNKNPFVQSRVNYIHKPLLHLEIYSRGIFSYFH